MTNRRAGLRRPKVRSSALYQEAPFLLERGLLCIRGGTPAGLGRTRKRSDIYAIPIFVSLRIKYLSPDLLLAGPALAQPAAYRLFQPGQIYTYIEAGGAPNTHLLRVDSAHATPAGDSVHASSWLVRPYADPGAAGLYYKSRNNASGALLRWRPGTANYVLAVLDESG